MEQNGRGEGEWRGWEGKGGDGGQKRTEVDGTSSRNNCNKCMYVTTRVRLRVWNLWYQIFDSARFPWAVWGGAMSACSGVENMGVRGWWSMG